MRPRTLAPHLLRLVRGFPALFLTGPRQSGKTTLARGTFPDFRYFSLEDLQLREEVREDPKGFLRSLEKGPGAILDEVQRVPDLFSYLQGFLDEERGGPLVLTGSQHFLLSERIGQSLAGRVAVVELLPYSVAELAGRPARTPEEVCDLVEVDDPPPASLEEVLFRGFYPRVHERELDPTTWLDGYVQTYVERDVRTLLKVGDLDAFARFVALCAGRSGQLLNASDLASDAGISHSTARQWLSVLRASYVLDLLQPHHENFSKRLVKTPKLHFNDTGLLCYLLGLRRPEDLRTHPLRGAVFETFVVSELKKAFLHHGRRPQLFFWRTQARDEVDLLVDLGSERVAIEAKSGQTLGSDAFGPLRRYLELSGGERGFVVYGGAESYVRGDRHVRSWWHLT